MPRPTSPRRAALLLPLVALALAAVTACGDATPPVAPSPSAAVLTQSSTQTRPTGKGIGVIGSKVNRTSQQIEYHGGPVMLGPANVYFIWYGNWAGMAARQQILTDFASNLGGSSYIGITTRYRNAAGQAPNGGVQYSGYASDAYSRGTSLQDYDVGFIVAEALIGNYSLPFDPDGIYVVFTSADVDIPSGFGTSYCGFHNTTNVNGTTIRVALVGSADRAPTTCQPQAVSPNGDPAADAMVSVLAAEIANTVTDPGFTAWYDKFLLEAADKCAWTYGTTYTTANGARANVHLGNSDYLLQQLWVPGKRGVCALSAGAP